MVQRAFNDADSHASYGSSDNVVAMSANAESSIVEAVGAKSAIAEPVTAQGLLAKSTTTKASGGTHCVVNKNNSGDGAGGAIAESHIAEFGALDPSEYMDNVGFTSSSDLPTESAASRRNNHPNRASDVSVNGASFVKSSSQLPDVVRIGSGDTSFTIPKILPSDRAAAERAYALAIDTLEVLQDSNQRAHDTILFNHQMFDSALEGLTPRKGRFDRARGDDAESSVVEAVGAKPATADYVTVQELLAKSTTTKASGGTHCVVNKNNSGDGAGGAIAESHIAEFGAFDPSEYVDYLGFTSSSDLPTGTTTELLTGKGVVADSENAEALGETPDVVHTAPVGAKEAVANALKIMERMYKCTSGATDDVAVKIAAEFTAPNPSENMNLVGSSDLPTENIYQGMRTNSTPNVTANGVEPALHVIAQFEANVGAPNGSAASRRNNHFIRAGDVSVNGDSFVKPSSQLPDFITIGSGDTSFTMPKILPSDRAAAERAYASAIDTIEILQDSNQRAHDTILFNHQMFDSVLEGLTPRKRRFDRARGDDLEETDSGSTMKQRPPWISRDRPLELRPDRHRDLHLLRRPASTETLVI